MRNHYSRKTVCKTAFSRKSVKDCLQDLETKRRKTYEELERENKSLIECKLRDFFSRHDATKLFDSTTPTEDELQGGMRLDLIGCAR